MRWKSAAVFVSLRSAETSKFSTQQENDVTASTDAAIQPAHLSHLVAIVLNKSEWHALRLPEAQAAIFCLRKGRRDRAELSVLIQCNDILFEGAVAIEPLQLPANFPSTVAASVELPVSSYRTCEEAYYQALTDVLPLLSWALQHGERVGEEYRGVRELQEVSYKWSLFRDTLRIYVPGAPGCLGASKAVIVRTMLGGRSARCTLSIGGLTGKSREEMSIPLRDDIDGLVLQAARFAVNAPTSKRASGKYAPRVVVPVNDIETSNRIGMQRLVAARSHDAMVIRFSAVLAQVIDDLKHLQFLPKLSVSAGELKDVPLARSLGELQALYSSMSKAQRSHVADMFSVHHAEDTSTIWMQFWAMQHAMWTVSPTLDLSRWPGWTEVLISLLDSLAVVLITTPNITAEARSKTEGERDGRGKREGAGDGTHEDSNGGNRRDHEDNDCGGTALTPDRLPSFRQSWSWCIDAMQLVTPSVVTPKHRKDINSASYWVLRFLLFALQNSNSSALVSAGLRVFPCLQLFWEESQPGVREVVLSTRAVCALVTTTKLVQHLDIHRTLPTITQLIRSTERLYGDGDATDRSSEVPALLDDLMRLFQSVWALAVRSQDYDRDECLDKVCETVYRLKCSATARHASDMDSQQQLRQIECRLYNCVGEWCAENFSSVCDGTCSLEGLQCFSLLQLGDLHIPPLMQAAASENLPPNFMDGVESYTRMLTKLAYVLPWVHRDLTTFRQKWVQPLVDMLVYMMCAASQPPQLKVAIIITDLLLALSLSPENHTSAFLLAPEHIEKLLYILTLYRDNSSLRSNVSKPEDGPTSFKATLSPEPFAVGEQIDGLYKIKSRRERWFPGVVQAIHPDGTMDILYDDGELTLHKPATEVRKTKRRSMRSNRSSRDGLAPSPTPSIDRSSAGGEDASPPQMRKSALVANEMLQRSLKAMHRRSVSHSILETSCEQSDATPRNNKPTDGQSDSDSDDAMVFSIPPKLNKSASLADLSSPVSTRVRLPDTLRFIRSSTQCGSAHSLSSALVNTEPTPGLDGERERERRDSYFTRGSAGSQRMLFENAPENGGTPTARGRAFSLSRPALSTPSNRVWNTWDAVSDYFRKKHASSLERGASLKSIDTTTSKLYSESSSETDTAMPQRQQLVAQVTALILLAVLNANDAQFHANPQLTDDATFESEGQHHSAGPILFSLREFFQSRNGHELAPVLFDFAQQRGRHYVSLLQLLGIGRTDKWMSSQTDVLMRIADGAFGSVFALHATSDTHGEQGLHSDLKLAVKRISRENSPYDRPIILEIFGEVSCLKRLRGERSVCTLVDFFPANSEFWIVLEHCEYSARFWRQKLGYTMRESQLQCVCLIFAAACAAVSKIHAHNVIHFDIKCDNILLRGDPMLLVENPARLQDVVCICDFGESLIVESDKLSQEALAKRSRGTLCIQSPEMLGLARRSGSKTRATIGKATDIWSLGCALYELMTGEYLFRNKEWTELFATLCSSDFQLPRAELEQCESLAESLGMRGALHEVFERTLRRESEARASAAEIHFVMQTALDQQQQLSEARPPGGSSLARSSKHVKPQQACVQILQAAAGEQSTAVVGGMVMLCQDRVALSFHPAGGEPVGKLPTSRLYLPSQAGFCAPAHTAAHVIVLCDALHPPPSISWPTQAVVVNTHSLSSIQQSMKLLLTFVQGVADTGTARPGVRASVHVHVLGDDDTPNSARTVPWQRPSVRCSAHTQLLAWAIVCAIQALDYVRAHTDRRLAVLQAWSDTRGAISTEMQLLGRAQALTDLAYELLSSVDLTCRP